MGDSIVQVEDTTVIGYLKKDSVQKRFEEILGKNARGFITSLLSVVGQDKKFMDVDPKTICTAALTAAALNLPINPNLGFAYIIPYNKQAQFQMGYKGFIQLGIRSGEFDTMATKVVYDGQVVEDDSFVGYHFDWKAKKSDNIIGYASYFKLLSGFSAHLFMTNEEIEEHAMEYSKSYKGSKTGNWKDKRDAMAKKTVLKLLLSRFAPLSVDMQLAVLRDQGIMEDEDMDNIKYPDNTGLIDAENETNSDLLQTRVDQLNDCKTQADVQALQSQNKPTNKEVLSLFAKRYDELKPKESLQN